MRNTPALDAVAALGLEHDVVRFERASSVAEGAARQGIPLGALFKTLVVRRGADDYLFVLVPGDREMDWSKVRRSVGARRLSLADADEAQRVTGYERGTITPFGATRAWPVFVDEQALRVGVIGVGGGAHGVSIHVDGASLVAALGATVADLTKPPSR